MDYRVPSGMSQLKGFSVGHKGQFKSTQINQLSDLTYQEDGWRDASNLEVGMWDYFQGKNKTLENSIAKLSLSVDVNRIDCLDDSCLKATVSSAYEEFLSGENGINTQARENFPEHSDADLSDFSPPLKCKSVRTLASSVRLMWTRVTNRIT